jgi:hypothetical protein
MLVSRFMPDNRKGGLGASSAAKAALLAVLLLVPVLLVSGVLIDVSQAQPRRSAWLKLVTESWKSVSVEESPDDDSDDDSVTVALVLPDTWTLVLPDPGLTGFADRYNVTNACVEVYRLKSGGGFDRAGTFYPNGNAR